ncbi:glutathione S-transferase [Dokdonella sp.]|uniref:glutathione S-transferase family protein n=1 Tax=Dokdonella sp. TaxID=2291710 RepID=UPI0026114C29|nr:glutathione S-transferase [Dokdonella sp.]
MYILYYSPGTASMAVHQTLIEIGAPHELRKVDIDAGEQKQADYLRLNPNGTVPTLVVDGAPTYECLALLLLLAERHPEAALAPAPGTPARATWLQWMAHLANTLQPAFRQWFYPQDFARSEHEQDSKAFARRRIEGVWQRLDAHLAAHGPFVSGADFGVADLYATMLMRWSRNMPKPATEWPALAALAARVKARPSWRRLYEIEGLSEWA